jgi:hypothetical protein
MHNMMLHVTAIPLRSIAAGELGRLAMRKRYLIQEKRSSYGLLQRESHKTLD